MPGPADIVRSAVGNLYTWAAQAIREGLSANKALDLLKSYDQGIRRADFLRIYGQARRGISLGEAINLHPGHYLPGRDLITPWQVNRPRGYVYQVGVTATDTESGSQILHMYSVTTTQLITKDEAEQQAHDAMVANAEQYGETIDGVYTHAIWEMVDRAVISDVAA
jgi:hypothetical protein